MAKTRQEAIAELTAPGETYELYEGNVLGRKCLKFKNAPPTLRDLFLEAKSEVEFLVYEDTRLTFEEAYIEARKSYQPRAEINWSHPIVYFAGKKVGWNNLNEIV